MKFITTIILLLSIGIQTVFAVNVEGRIIDKQTNKPLQGAVLLALVNNKVIASVESNVKGDFKIKRLCVGACNFSLVTTKSCNNYNTYNNL